MPLKPAPILIYGWLTSRSGSAYSLQSTACPGRGRWPVANRFLLANLQPRGTITLNQERFLIGQPPGTLARYRRELGIFGAIPRLSKGDAWRLINRISQDVNGGAA